jgi:magnesium transporter
VLGQGFVVSVDRDTDVLERAGADLLSDPELAGTGPAAVLPCVVDHAVKGYDPVLSGFNDVSEELETAVFTAGETSPTERIYRLSRQLLEFRRAAAPLAELLDRLAGDPPTPTDDRLARRFREQRAHLVHQVELAEGLGTLLSNVLQANLTEVSVRLTEVSVRQNDDMRRISAWVAIWAIPTLLAGIYGMNFKYLPELDWPLGYPLVIVVMAVSCLMIYRAFRRSGWL